MTGLDDNRIVKSFAELRASGGKALVPFITAGYPDLETTLALLKDFEARGVGVCELGVPFSDPVADGPTIQASYSSALEAGVCCDDIFKMIRRYRDDGGAMALAAMVSYSIVFRRNVRTYLAAAAEAGFDGLIIPDLPLEEAAELEPMAAKNGLADIMLIAPTTPPERRLEIARHCRGFIYFISVAGITGERKKLPQAALAAVADLRRHTHTPICIGFGVSTPQMVAGVCQAADGAIVGSAIIRRIAEHKDAPPDELVSKVGRFVGELLAPLK